MQSIDLIRENLKRSESLVLLRVEEMRNHCMVPPTSRGGAHTLWVLGHLAYIERLIIEEFLLGRPNPLNHWKEVFDGADISDDVAEFPSFDEALLECKTARTATNSFIDSLVEEELDMASAQVPIGTDELFGTYRRCLQYASDHWLMHRGQLADARRAAGVDRMWF